MSERNTDKKLRSRCWNVAWVLFGIFLLGLFNSSRSVSNGFLLAVSIMPLVIAFIAVLVIRRERSRSRYAGDGDTTPQQDDDMIFPSGYAYLNAAVLFLTNIVYWPASDISGYQIFLVLTIFFMSLLVPTCIWVQGILFYSLRKFITNKTFWISFLFAPSFLFSVSIVYDSLPRRSDAESILEFCELAPLPKEASNVRAVNRTGWNGYGEKYLAFKAPRSVINEFIKCSPSLTKVQPLTCSEGEIPAPINCCFPPKNEIPSWFPHEVSRNFKYYDFHRIVDPDSPDHTSCYGFVLVDDVKNIVYVYVF